jgi:hypothetical protein
VTIVGDKGAPKLPTTEVPGCDCRLGVDSDGYATLESRDTAAVELWNAPLPYPVKLDLEFAVISSRPEDTSVGAYVGRKETPAAIGRLQTLVWFAYHKLPDQQTPPKWTERRSTIQGWGWDSPIDDKTTLEEKVNPTPAPILNPKREWQSLTVIIDAEQVEGAWNGAAFAPVKGGVFRNNLDLQMQRFFPQAGLNFIQPTYGPGIGLLLYNGEIEYRNVKLVRLFP